jgi:hypothetical protein
MRKLGRTGMKVAVLCLGGNYAIMDEAMLKEGAEKLQTLHDTQQGPARGKIGRGVLGRGGIEPPTPGFSVRLGTLNHQLHPRSHVVIEPSYPRPVAFR